MRRFSLARRRLPGVVSLLDVVIHHQISKQLPGVPPRVPRHGLNKGQSQLDNWGVNIITRLGNRLSGILHHFVDSSIEWGQ